MHEKRGAHFYFRNRPLPMRERFAGLMDMASAPRVFLHGSPHIDNYAKSNQAPRWPTSTARAWAPIIGTSCA